MDLLNIWLSFLAGLFAPLGAVCVLPLYPGFLAYLASQIKTKQEPKNQEKNVPTTTKDSTDSIALTSDKKLLITLGLLVTAGIIISMFIVGLIFTKFLQVSLTTVTSIISPIAFTILTLFSLLLIADVELSKFIPQIQSPTTKNPYLTSILFGLFFGIIVLPCNPASLVILFALSTNFTSFLTNFIAFLVFGLGMALPLLLLTLISANYSQSVIKFLTTKKKIINRSAGLIMLLISLYYLITVFKVFS